ncbi:MAG: flippase-like domain-containing protein [Clostridia bacterium]|nr:flippase-like domain-containing protein [Clostridia bacterium]
MSNEKNTLPANEKGKKSKKFKTSLAETFDSEFMEKVKPEEKIPDADFIAQKSDKETRRKIVKSIAFGIKPEEKQIGRRQKLYKVLFTVLFVVFVVGVLAFTAYRDFFASGRDFPSWGELKLILKESWRYLLYALFALFLTFFFKALKLSIMCKSLTKKFHFKTCFETAIIGCYYNNVTPLAVGGQPFEIYHLSKHGVHGGVASSIPIASFMLNQFAFVILGIFFISAWRTNDLDIPLNLYNVLPTTFYTLAIIGLICCFMMPFLVVLFSLMPKIGAKLVHFIMWVGSKLRIVKNPKETTIKTVKNVIHNATCLKKICKNPLVFILSFLVSFLEHAASVSMAFFVLKAFGYDITQTINGVTTDVGLVKEWLQVAQICILIFASITFIPTPGNSGAADLSFFLLFEVGLYAGLAFPAMVIWRGFSFYSYIIIGFIFATLKKKADHKREQMELQAVSSDGFISGQGEQKTNLESSTKNNNGQNE